MGLPLLSPLDSADLWPQALSCFPTPSVAVITHFPPSVSSITNCTTDCKRDEGPEPQTFMVLRSLPPTKTGERKRQEITAWQSTGKEWLLHKLTNCIQVEASGLQFLAHPWNWEGTFERSLWQTLDHWQLWSYSKESRNQRCFKEWINRALYTTSFQAYVDDINNQFSTFNMLHYFSIKRH